jgi:hypothetical protein
MDLKPSRHQARVGRWPPDTVVAYAAIVVAILAVSLAREGAHERLVYGGSLLALSTVGLWRSVWIAWLFLVFVMGWADLQPRSFGGRRRRPLRAYFFTERCWRCSFRGRHDATPGAAVRASFRRSTRRRRNSALAQAVFSHLARTCAAARS